MNKRFATGNTTALVILVAVNMVFGASGGLVAGELLVQKNAHVAVAGDSITEAKQYSRFMEMYLTVCQPQLEAEVCQFGHSGERASGFLQRMDDDLKFFKPTLVTLCYGMNDGSYKAYTPAIGDAYEKPMIEIVGKLKTAGAIVVVGGPGNVDPDFLKKTNPESYNKNLQTLSETARKIAGANGFPHADVYGAMTDVMVKAKAALGKDYDGGGDGIHPKTKGHLVMAYAFLKTMGFDGDLGTITLDLKGKATSHGGHEIKSFANGRAEIESKRYPFCFTEAGKGILPFIPFNADLNRLTLVVRNADSANLKVNWGGQSKTFSREALERGVNLAAEFIPNPFNEAFASVDAAVQAKEEYETEMIRYTFGSLRSFKKMFNGDAESIAAVDVLEKKSVEKWEKLDKAVKASFKPVTHAIRIERVP